MESMVDDLKFRRWRVHREAYVPATFEAFDDNGETRRFCIVTGDGPVWEGVLIGFDHESGLAKVYETRSNTDWLVALRDVWI
jgi:hypothetical protein